LEAGQTKQLPTFHGNINVNVSFQGHLYTFKINLRWFSALCWSLCLVRLVCLLVLEWFWAIFSRIGWET